MSYESVSLFVRQDPAIHAAIEAAVTEYGAAHVVLLRPRHDAQRVAVLGCAPGTKTGKAEYLDIIEGAAS